MSCNDKNRKQREELPGYYSHLQSITSKNFGYPPRKMKLRYEQKSARTSRQKRSENQQPGDKRKYRQEDWWIRQAILCGNDCKFTRPFRNPLQKSWRYWTIKRTLESGSLRRVFISDTSKKPDKENDQGVGLCTFVKLIYQWSDASRTRRRL